MTSGKGVVFAILAAALYAIYSPCAKLLLLQIPPTMMAACLYLGAGVGMALVGGARRCFRGKSRREPPLTRADTPYVIGMVLLDIAAPIFLMRGLARTNAATVSLLNNFEIVATSVLALALFQEKVSRRLWLAVGLVTVASAMLSLDGGERVTLSGGALLVLLACVCWGLENNCTRRLSDKDPLEIVVVKGFGSGAGALVVALCVGERLPGFGALGIAMALGFVAYGLSIFCYIYAQRTLGAARTSTYYALAPFIGAGLSLLLLREAPSGGFWPALVVMLAGALLAATDGDKTKPEA